MKCQWREVLVCFHGVCDDRHSTHLLPRLLVDSQLHFAICALPKFPDYVKSVRVRQSSVSLAFQRLWYRFNAVIEFLWVLF